MFGAESQQESTRRGLRLSDLAPCHAVGLVFALIELGIFTLAKLIFAYESSQVPIVPLFILVFGFGLLMNRSTPIQVRNRLGALFGMAILGMCIAVLPLNSDSAWLWGTLRTIGNAAALMGAQPVTRAQEAMKANQSGLLVNQAVENRDAP